VIDKDVLERVLARALRDGADFAEVFVEDRVASSAVLDDGRIEELTSGRERGAGIRVITGESTGFAHTTDLTETGLLDAAAVAAAAARGGTGSVRSISLTERAVTPTAIAVRPDGIAKADKVQLLQRAEAAARGTGNDIRQVMAMYADNRRRFVVANSEGVFASDDQTRTRLAVQCVAVGDTGMQTGFEALAGVRGWEMFDDRSPESVAEEAARRALVKLDARPAPSGLLPVVLAAGSGGVLFHEACGHGLEADHIVKGSSTFAGRVGEQVASPLVTLVDDGTVTGAWGNLAVDDEGHPATRNVLIQDGVLADYMWDGRSARKEKHALSGNGRRQTYKVLPMVRMTNTYLLNGDSDPDDIVASTERGVFVKKLGGGQVDTASGDFVFGMVESYLIENGEITEPLRESNLVGNGPDVLTAIDAVANDFKLADGGGMCGKDGQSVPVGMGQPTLRVAAMTVGGTAS
jgi:TldD protein